MVPNSGHLNDSFIDQQTTSHGVSDRFGLLINFLQHEMLKSTFVDFLQIDLKFLSGWSYFEIVFYFSDINIFVQLNRRHFTIIQINGIFGKLNERRSI